MDDEAAQTDPVVEDLRLLKLAELYEGAYERFIIEMATQVVDDDDVRAQLMRLVAPEDDHAGRVAQLMSELNRRLDARGRRHLTLAALQDVVEIERSARDFYKSHAGQANDPAVRQLFEELAKEEERHARVAEATLDKVSKVLGVGRRARYGYRPFGVGMGPRRRQGGGSG